MISASHWRKKLDGSSPVYGLILAVTILAYLPSFSKDIFVRLKADAITDILFQSLSGKGKIEMPYLKASHFPLDKATHIMICFQLEQYDLIPISV